MDIKLHTNLLLKKVGAENLEQLRELRNSPAIQRVLVKPGIISREAQLAWFDATDPAKNAYFLVYIDGKPEGYALLKHIRAEEKTAEPGIFLADPKHYGSTLGALLTIAFLDFCHAFYGIDYFTGNVLKANERAVENYQAFDTARIAAENPHEIRMTGRKPYPEMEKINRMRQMLVKLEGYDPGLSVSGM